MTLPRGAFLSLIGDAGASIVGFFSSWSDAGCLRGINGERDNVSDKAAAVSPAGSRFDSGTAASSLPETSIIIHMNAGAYISRCC